MLFNAIIPPELGFRNDDMKKKKLSELVFDCYRQAGLAATVSFLDRLKEFGFHNATRGGVLENVFMRNVEIGKVGEAVLTIDLLYEEGAKCPKMMSIGLHCRLVGRPDGEPTHVLVADVLPELEAERVPVEGE